MKRVLRLSVVVLIAVLPGCTTHMLNPTDPNASLVYGFIDMSDAPSNVDYVTLRQYKPKPKDGNPYRNAKAVDGLFWFDQLPPGTYQVVSFGGHSWWKNTSYSYSMHDFAKNETAITIQKPGLYYLGAYKYKKEGPFSSGKFSMIRLDSPTEKEILQRLLPYSTDTQWEAMIKKRIGALK